MTRDSPETRSIELRLLGAFRVVSSGEDVTPKGKKTRALLAMAVLSDRCELTRERAAGLLWSDRGAEQARVSLRQSLAELRSSPACLADVVTATRERIMVDASRIVSDVSDILASEVPGGQEKLVARLDAWDGDLLQDLYGLSPGFDEWLLMERSRWRDMLVARTFAAARTAFEEQDLATAHSILGGLERVEAGHEPAVRLGMQVNSQAGDLAGIHRRYRRLVDVLQREFATRPSDETRQLFYELTRLPAEPASLSGRAPGIAPAVAAAPVIIVGPLIAIDNNLTTGQIAAICTDDIRTTLARHRDLRVIPIDQPDMERIGRVCAGAQSAYLLSGSLRAVDEDLRCNVNLSVAATGLVRWSDQLTITERTIEGAIDRIVARAVGAVAPVIERDLAGQHSPEISLEESTLLYASARRQLYRAQDFRMLRDAADKLERVVSANSAHAGARLLLAQLYNTDFFQNIAGHDPAPYRRRALELALQAVALDPDNAVAQLRLAWCFLRRGDWADAATRFENAVRLARFDSLVLDEAGFGLSHAGELAAGESLMRRAFELNPFPPSDFHADLAVLLALKGDRRAAEEQFEASGEKALHYLAVRLVNMAGSGRGCGLGVADALRRSFGMVWAGALPWTDADLIAWVGIYLPLRDETARAWLASGLTHALAQGG